MVYQLDLYKIQQTLDSIKYKDLHFKLQPVTDSLVEIYFIGSVKDNFNSKNMVDVGFMQPVQSDEPKAIIYACWQLVQYFEQHEAAEKFWVNDSLPFDPHRNNK